MVQPWCIKKGSIKTRDKIEKRLCDKNKGVQSSGGHKRGADYIQDGSAKSIMLAVHNMLVLVYVCGHLVEALDFGGAGPGGVRVCC